MEQTYVTVGDTMYEVRYNPATLVVMAVIAFRDGRIGEPVEFDDLDLPNQHVILNKIHGF
jgi:hypothetical protein